MTVDEPEIREFLERDYPRMVNGLALAFGSFPAAEDAVQEALARAWEMGEKGRLIDDPRAWVAAVARNLLRDRFRRMLAERRARGRLNHQQPTASEAVDRQTDLSAALARLPRRQREVAVYRYYLDFEIAEIAAALRIPDGTVKSALHRARRSLAEALGEEDDERVEVGDVAG